MYVRHELSRLGIKQMVLVSACLRGYVDFEKSTCIGVGIVENASNTGPWRGSTPHQACTTLMFCYRICAEDLRVHQRSISKMLAP
jgi:hypothetical protein